MIQRTSPLASYLTRSTTRPCRGRPPHGRRPPPPRRAAAHDAAADGAAAADQHPPPHRRRLHRPKRCRARRHVWRRGAFPRPRTGGRHWPRPRRRRRRRCAAAAAAGGRGRAPPVGLEGRQVTVLRGGPCRQRGGGQTTSWRTDHVRVREEMPDGICCRPRGRGRCSQRWSSASAATGGGDEARQTQPPEAAEDGTRCLGTFVVAMVTGAAPALTVGRARGLAPGGGGRGVPTAVRSGGPSVG